MPEVTVTLNEVESKDVNTKRGLSTVYRLKGSDGRTYTTFDHELAKQAAQFRGQAVLFTFTESKNGEWTNYNLDSVKLSAFAPAPEAASIPTEQYSQLTTANTSKDKDVSIARAVALKAAVETVVGCGYDGATNFEAATLRTADIYVDWLLTGVSPFGSVAEVVDTAGVPF